MNRSIILVLLILCQIPDFFAKQKNQKTVIDDIADLKDFKKLLRTKNNVLVCFVTSQKQSSEVLKVFEEAADVIKGSGTMVLVDCAGSGKKMCKKLKVSPEPYIFKHYLDGDWNKDYNRRETVTSMVNFMRDPSGDLPWDEDSTALDILHVPDNNALTKLLKKETQPILVMFYAPWCSYCKSLKPEYAAAATELKGHAIMSAIDVNRPENSGVRKKYNITGFPTMLYFHNGVQKYTYDGDNKKDSLVNFMRNPGAAPVKPKEEEWSDTDSDVVHLTSLNFHLVIKEAASVLVMFYAPWCGYCKKMKPEYEAAAAKLKQLNVKGMLAALDATKESSLAKLYNVKGYPTLKYFVYGEHKYDVTLRDTNALVEFMKDPKEPPPPPPPEAPWSQQESAVVHLTDSDYKQFLKKKKHVLVMFYAPWCGHCKKVKPEFTAAAEKFKGVSKVELAAVDCTVNTVTCNTYEIQGYPSLKYFNYFDKAVKNYVGDRTAEDFANYIISQDESLASQQKAEWDIHQGAEHIVHLSDINFDEELDSGQPLFVMFYEPKCESCKSAQSKLAQLAAELNATGSDVRIGASDSTHSPVVELAYKVKKYPTFKFFNKGKYESDYGGKISVQDFLDYIIKVSRKKVQTEL
ncbi:protein disulfide-isomerase A5 [Neodiprion virginianus]|uniref:protein disulfide-isomerase A5 n=1 Tax=Neodiprion virginianus TaxID=2961670 RepID=UPI00076FC0B3|nr:protein disulfide-isomerase A5 [Neodiprion virginianus]